MEKYCSIVGMRIKPGDCGTFKECGDPAQCGLRKYYGWADMGTKGMQARQEAQQQIKQAAKDEADLERFGPRTCNICHKEFSAPEAFRMRKDGKERKKTCADCEDKYVKKTVPTNAEKSGRKKKAYNTCKCWWPGCERNAVAIGLCKYHKMRDNNGTLLRIDQHAFPRDEVLQMYRDVIAFAERAGISVDEAVAWLVAEGLNSFERRSRG
jgi:hypothetical protein